MSVQITIGKNQGITQAIRDKIAASEDVKNTDLKTWQEVVKLVEGNSQSIFKKDNNNGTQFTTDRTKINDKSSNHSNYVVDQGTITIDGGIWAKIKDLLTGSKTEKTQDEAKLKKLEPPPPADLTQNPVDLNAKVESKINTDNINIPVVATGKQLTRSVNGTQQKIEIQNVNGQKVRFAVNDDGTRGEQLVTVTTAGKNTYVTKSEFDKTVKSALQLGENDEIPKGLNAEYVSIGGEATLVFKGKDGHVMTGSEVKKFMTDYKQDLYDRTAHGSGEYAGKSIKDITNEVVSKIDYSKLPSEAMEEALKNNGVQLNYGGKMYTVKQGKLVDAQGNKFNIQNNKLVPVKTEQESTYTYTKRGGLNINNDNPSAFWFRGPIEFE